MKHLSTYLPPFFYAALAIIFVVLYASNGVINGDFLYGFERFSLLSDEPSPPELPNISEIFLLASSMFIGSFIAWQVSKPKTWRIYLFCTLLSILLSFLVTYIISMLFTLVYLVYDSSECGFTLMKNIMNYLAASFFCALFYTIQSSGLFILPILCSCLQSAVIVKTWVWLKKVQLKRTLIFIPFIFLYLVCIDKGMITIDPCSATPGHDYTTGIIVLASFPFVAGVLLHWCLRDFNIPKRKRYWIAGLLPSILLAISSFPITYLLYIIEEGLRDTKLWTFIYDRDFYNDAFPKPFILFIAITAMFYLLLLMAFITFRICTTHKNTDVH